MSDQKNRLMTIDTPLGPDFFVVESFHGKEEISQLFRFEIELRAKTLDVGFSRMIDQPVTLTLNLVDGTTRFFHGIVADFTQTLGSADLMGSFSYKCTIVPWTWTLTQTSDLRIFTNKTIPDIIEEFLQKYGFADYELKINKTHTALPLCTQFQESDFAFLSRLMERAGIFYFFKHEEKRHVMVMTDTNTTIKDFQKDKKAQFKTTDTNWHTDENILDLYWREKIRSRQITLQDYNSEMPSAALMSSTDTNSKLGTATREYYEYPGDFTTHGDAENLSKLRMEEQEAKLTKVKGKSTYRTMQAGSKFTLENYFREDRNNKSYLLVSVTHSIAKDDPTKGKDAALHYWNDFSCMPTAKPFRPPRKTKKPKVYGVQVAKVTSDPDEYGRVAINIVWDRNKETIPNVPVSQIMAGENWGTMFVPHIGHEVIVDFIGGDPDKPIIVGRLYNGDNKPQYPLPAEKTKSVIYSEGENEIVIEDKEGDKYIRIEQACGNEIELHEKDPTITIQQACGNHIILGGESGEEFIELHSPRNNSTLKIGENGGNKDPLALQIQSAMAIFGKEVSLPGPGFTQSSDGDFFAQNTGDKVTYTNGSTLEYGLSNSIKCTAGLCEELALSIKNTQTIGLESQIFAGGKYAATFAYQINRTHGIIKDLNDGGIDLTTKKHYRLKADDNIALRGGPSTSGNLDLNKKGVLLNSKGSFLQLKKASDVLLQSKKNMTLKAKGLDISLESKEIYLDASTKLDIDAPAVLIKGKSIKIG